jgi:hypothetical protein
MEAIMKRTVNVKRLLMVCGIILSGGLIYLVGSILPNSLKITSGVPPFNIFWERIINGTVAILMLGLVLSATALVVAGIYYLFGWIFPKRKLG